MSGANNSDKNARGGSRSNSNGARRGPNKATGKPGRRRTSSAGKPTGSGKHEARQGGPRQRNSDGRAGGDGASRGRGRDDRDGWRGRNRNDRGGRDTRDRYDRVEEEPTNRFDDGSGGEKRTGPKKWGGVARRGAYHLGAREEDDAREFSPEEQAAYEARVAKRAAEAARREGLRQQAADAIARSGGEPVSSKGKARAPKRDSFDRQPLPARTPEVDLEVSLARVLGDAEGAKARKKVRRAATAFEEGRYDDARQILKPLVDMAPGIGDLREIYGLTLYRMGRWRQAADQLEQFRVLAGSAEQNAVLADAYRAQQRWSDVEFLWEELREHSPSGAAVNEGRIVAAGALADRGQLGDAVRLLEQGWSRPKRPREDHLSRAYALADLYERAGEAAVARELFGWIASHDPYFSDAAERSRG